jgi:uncharacterized protein YbjT (DUF2867 family)
MTDQQEILVLGATGKTGRRIVERLQSQGVAVRPGSRDASPPFDWEDRRTWAPALDGVRAVYISYFPDLAVPGACEAVSEVARLAVAGGARRLVLLSGRGETEAQATERAVQAIAPSVTIVCCSWFMQNFSEDYLLEPILAGEVALPVGATPEPFVDADDIADVAVAALTEDAHAGELYELTGPRLLTFADATAEIASVTGRSISFRSVATDEYTDAMKADGVPAEVVSLITYLFTEVLDGRNAHIADGVERALGRPPRDFSDFIRDAAAAGAWSARGARS